MLAERWHYKFAAAPAMSDGWIAVTGALVQWLRDNLGLIASSADVEALARTVRITAASISSLPSPGSLPRTGDRMPAA